MTRFHYLVVFGLFQCIVAAASAAILEDFQFGDSNGTLLGAAANSVNAANLWAEDTADMDNSAVLNGVYHIRKMSAIDPPNGFGTNFLNIDNVTAGQVWLVAEIAGWHYASGTTNLDDFNPAELEEIRFDFLDNDTGTSGSTVTAEVNIMRNSSGGVDILGTALGAGGMPIAAQPLSLSQNEPFTVVLGLDKTANMYEIYTKSGAGAFALLGTNTIEPARNGNSIRFVANNSFAGTGEFFDIDRIYLTNTNPIPEPTGMLLVGLSVTTLAGLRRRKGVK